MKEINTENWQEFQIGKLFQVSRGRRFVVGKHKEGNIPYYSASLENNGITDYISNPLFIDKNAIIVTTFCDAFYAKGEFTASDEITILHHEKMNEINGLFIASAIRKNAWKYSFKVKAFQTRIIEDTIKLPINKKGEPDWEYMESYMKNIMQESEKNIKNLQNISELKGRIQTEKWRNFSCSELFNAKNTGNILSRDIEDGSGKTPYVTASGINNGVVAYIDASKYDIIEGHCILIGGKTFTVTYQSDDFVSNDSHNFVIRTNSYNISDFSYKYLVTVIRSYFGQKYSWNDAVTKDKFFSENIPLPANSNGEPDWDYMENYMKNIMKDTTSKLDKLVCC